MEPTIANFAHLQIPLEDIEKATNNFATENISGKGDFGNVYRGKLVWYGKLIKISARRLDRKRRQGDVEFWTEVSMLSSLTHENIVSMIGFCDEKGEKIIVNRSCPKGSLSMHLGNPKLRWKQRVDILIGVVRAIEYIHAELGRTYYVIHRNINSSTILLDKNWKPKLSGFEFSIQHPVERKNQVFLSDAIGTCGYMDPEDIESGGVTHKSDIYALGVVFLEILCGRKANENNTMLVPLATFHYNNETLQDIIHPDLWSQIHRKSFKCFKRVAFMCLRSQRSLRLEAKQLLPPLEVICGKENRYDSSGLLMDEKDEHDAFRLPMEEKDGTDEHDPSQDTIGSVSSNPTKVHILEHLRIPLKDIEVATDYFSKISRRNQWGTVYEWNYLECFDREYVLSIDGKNEHELPKRLYRVEIMSIRREDIFHKEIEILGRSKHPNIHSLLGFCDEGRHMIIVYELIIPYYLGDQLQDNLTTWEESLKICIHVAHGLNYLQNGRDDQKRVVHRDINSYRITGRNNGIPKIHSFKKSVFLPMDQDDDALHLEEIVGEEHYIDPEHVKTSKLTKESDIFSFGVVMFEIFCGTLVQSVMTNHKDVGLSQLVQQWFTDGSIKKKLASKFKAENYENKNFLPKGPNKDSLNAFLEITRMCLEETQNQRPQIEVVVKELKKALSFQSNHNDPFRMSFENIKSATEEFSSSNCIGKGGFGKVFKGKLAHKDGNGEYNIVAKKLDKSGGQGDKQYYNELQILYEYKHENVIGLVGYSNETDEKLIVYEQASMGSLDSYLNKHSLKWRNRLNICIDVATGLDFIHGGNQGQDVVIHRDLKSANILLFDNWNAKIGDFGLSLISTINKETNFIIDHPCGTMGYLDPLYYQSGILTVESDMYSFGVLLFEILCGKEAYAILKNKSGTLLDYINSEEVKQDELVFEALKKEIMPKSLTVFLDIVRRCLAVDKEKRPTSKEVLIELKSALEFQDEDKI